MLLRFVLLLLLACGPALAGDCPTAYLELAGASTGRLPQPPLEELVRASGLSQEQFEILQKNGKAVMDVEDFLRIREGLGQGYLLAKDKMNYSSEFFSNRMGLRHWYDGYDNVGMRMRWKHPDPSYHTPEFLTKITDTGEPIVFLVPPGIMDGTEGFTRAEMRWVLENPDRLKNMYFVFGAYDFLPKEVVDEFARTRNFDKVREFLRPTP
jgi:hypothetical protein